MSWSQSSPGTRLLIRLLGLYVVGSSVLAALLTGFVLRQQWSQLMGEMVKRASTTARLVSLSVTAPLYGLDVETIIRHIDHLRALPDVAAVTVFDGAARVVTDGTGENPRIGQRDEPFAAVLTRPGVDPDFDEGPRVLGVLAVARLHERPVGGIRIDMSLDALHARVGETRRLAVGLALVLIGLGLVPVYAVTNFLIKPFFVGGR